MIYAETLYPKTAKTLKKLVETKGVTGEFYLAGGTALALQLGHRRSIDLDWFYRGRFDPVKKLEELRNLHPIVTAMAEDTLDVMIDEVKVSWLGYDYGLLEPLVEGEGFGMASVLDIAGMKIAAIVSRGTKKDFVDFYYLLQRYNLEELLGAFERKYRGLHYDKGLIFKSLVYFEDAEGDIEVDFMSGKHPSWEQIKSFIRGRVRGEFQRLMKVRR